MAGCFQVVSGYLQHIGEFDDSCSGFALVTAAEFRDIPTFATLFAFPESEALRQAFIAGISLPLILWLSAWGFGTVVHFINHRTDHHSTYED